jgi:hypothetical protein
MELTLIMLGLAFSGVVAVIIMSLLIGITAWATIQEI